MCPNGTARRNAYSRNGYRSALKMYWNVLNVPDVNQGMKKPRAE